MSRRCIITGMMVKGNKHRRRNARVKAPYCLQHGPTHRQQHNPCCCGESGSLSQEAMFLVVFSNTDAHTHRQNNRKWEGRERVRVIGPSLFFVYTHTCTYMTWMPISAQLMYAALHCNHKVNLLSPWFNSHNNISFFFWEAVYAKLLTETYSWSTRTTMQHESATSVLLE